MEPINDDQVQLSAYDKKVMAIFNDTCINKVLVNENMARELPRYIFEWLLSKYQEKGQLSPENRNRLRDLIEKHFPDPEKINLYKYRLIRENAELHILNPYRVSIDARTEKYSVYCPFLARETANIDLPDNIVEKNKGLLLNGLWGIASFVHDPNKERPLVIKDFKPVQIEEVHLDQFIKARGSFTLPEWIDLLINTMGLNPASFPSNQEKIYMLARMLPYVEKNLHLIEMGPKGTGKSFIHKNISTHVHVISGGTITRAQLFYHVTKREPGLLIVNDVIVFDDFSNIHVEDEVIGKLKNFMADGIIDVGSFKEPSSASVVLQGNVALDVTGNPANQFCFKNLPKEMQESAFLDRISMFIPGWKLHPIRSADLSVGYGLIGDWFSEILHQMRLRNYMPEVENNIIFGGQKSRMRDINHMKATASALIKLLFPDKDTEMEIQDWHFVAGMAVDLRQRVIEQLARIDPEFRDIKLDYQINE
jgi:ATP-dependent Lon protease